MTNRQFHVTELICILLKMTLKEPFHWLLIQVMHLMAVNDKKTGDLRIAQDKVRSFVAISHV